MIFPLLEIIGKKIFNYNEKRKKNWCRNLEFSYCMICIVRLYCGEQWQRQGTGLGTGRAGSACGTQARRRRHGRTGAGGAGAGRVGAGRAGAGRAGARALGAGALGRWARRVSWRAGRVRQADAGQARCMGARQAGTRCRRAARARGARQAGARGAAGRRAGRGRRAGHGWLGGLGAAWACSWANGLCTRCT